MYINSIAHIHRQLERCFVINPYQSYIKIHVIGTPFISPQTTLSICGDVHQNTSGARVVTT